MPTFKSLLSLLLVSSGALVLAAPPELPPVTAAPPPVIYSCTKPNTAAITFDDGPYNWMREIVDQLSDAGAKGTFFLNGRNWACIYDEQYSSSIQYAYKKGHQIASHTWSHASLDSLSEAQIHNELQQVDTALKKIIGVVPKYVRPPYGNYNDLARKVAADRKVKLVNWDVDSRDAAGASPDESKGIYDDFIGNHPHSMNALNHETHESSAREVLPYVIDLLRDNGYKMVTVAECLGDTPYLSVGKPSKRDGSWHC